MRNDVFLHTTGAVERVVDDVATAGKAELQYRRKVVRSSGAGMGQCSAVVSALPPTEPQHVAMSTPPSASAACARSARHHFHLVLHADHAGICSASQMKSSARPCHPTEPTGSRLLAARRPRFISSVHDIQAAISLREYELILRASFDTVRCDYRLDRTCMLFPAPGLVYLPISHPLA